jgi:hypothetical protein
MPDSSSLQREVEAEARRLFPGAVRRVEWLGYGDSPLIEPGEILPQFVLAEPAVAAPSPARCGSVPVTTGTMWQRAGCGTPPGREGGVRVSRGSSSSG